MQPERQELILLSDTLGLSSLVNLMHDQDGASQATESSVLGPFYRENTQPSTMVIRLPSQAMRASPCPTMGVSPTPTIIRSPVQMYRFGKLMLMVGTTFSSMAKK